MAFIVCGSIQPLLGLPSSNIWNSISSSASYFFLLFLRLDDQPQFYFFCSFSQFSFVGPSNFQDPSASQSEWRWSARCGTPSDSDGRFCQYDLGNCQTSVFLCFLLEKNVDASNLPVVKRYQVGRLSFLIFLRSDSSTGRQQWQSGNEPTGTFTALGSARRNAGHWRHGCGCDYWLDSRRRRWNCEISNQSSDGRNNRFYSHFLLQEFLLLLSRLFHCSFFFFLFLLHKFSSRGELPALVVYSTPTVTPSKQTGYASETSLHNILDGVSQDDDLRAKFRLD